MSSFDRISLQGRHLRSGFGVILITADQAVCPALFSSHLLTRGNHTR